MFILRLVNVYRISYHFSTVVVPCSKPYSKQRLTYDAVIPFSLIQLFFIYLCSVEAYIIHKNAFERRKMPRTFTKLGDNNT